MKKRLTALMLVLVLLFSMTAVTACNKKETAPATVQDVVASISKITLNKADIVYDFDMGSEGSFAMKMTAANATATQGIIDISVKFDFSGYSVSEYTPLTTMYVDNDTIYINLKSIVDFAAGVDEQLASVAAYISFPGDYLKVSLDDVVALYESMGIDMGDTDFSTLTQTSEEDQKKVVDALTALCSGLLGEIADKSGTATVADGFAEFNVNNENLKSFVDACAQIDVEKYFTDYAQAVKSVAGMEATAEQIETSMSGVNDAIKDAAASFDEEAANGLTGNFKLRFGVQDDTAKKGAKNAVVSCSFDGSEGETVMKFNMDMVTYEDKASDFSLPESVMTVDDLMQMLSDLGIF